MSPWRVMTETDSVVRTFINGSSARRSKAWRNFQLIDVTERFKPEIMSVRLYKTDRPIFYFSLFDVGNPESYLKNYIHALILDKVSTSIIIRIIMNTKMLKFLFLFKAWFNGFWHPSGRCKGRNTRGGGPYKNVCGNDSLQCRHLQQKKSKISVHRTTGQEWQENEIDHDRFHLHFFFRQK